MATPKEDGAMNGLSEATKRVVSTTRMWATAVRDASLAPAIELIEHDRSAEPLLGPWVQTAVWTHEWLWTTWEESAFRFVDQSWTAISRPRR